MFWMVFDNLFIVVPELTFEEVDKEVIFLLLIVDVDKLQGFPRDWLERRSGAPSGESGDSESTWSSSAVEYTDVEELDVSQPCNTINSR